MDGFLVCTFPVGCDDPFAHIGPGAVRTSQPNSVDFVNDSREISIVFDAGQIVASIMLSKVVQERIAMA